MLRGRVVVADSLEGNKTLDRSFPCAIVRDIPARKDLEPNQAKMTIKRKRKPAFMTLAV
jgi:hypothetical protein